ncbi:hypothetical protein B0T25DRAFT_464766 [Lasiosphaeria hispida]|uniref:DUF2406 domain-containing protein n=1 Tax=Lasiosphaeria hispida TaxID=260671 RepID=A0AAJ0M8J7_9PEZI|nr:hypothetical protein B0T25DRAFT_464766 [Lasiosphaeria hispida]
MATSNDLPPAPPHHQQQQQYGQAQPQYQPQYQQSQHLPAPHSKSHPPVTQQRTATQTRKPRSFSFRSDKSHGSNGNNSVSQKQDLHETSAEKEAKRLHSKADPTLAMNEAEPAEVAATGKSSLAPLRSIQHKDAFGNPIADPDRSNPTRSRWERPLDTIRSFEAAIDGGYPGSRRSILRSDSESVALGNNRRSSYYGDGSGGRFSHDSYYGSRPPSMMYGGQGDGSQHDLRQGGRRDTFHDQQHHGPGPSHTPGPRGPPMRGYLRTGSEPQFAPPQRQLNPNEYAIPNNHRSYETVTTASGSGTSAEPSGYQTDPTSSDNSSVERMQAVPKRQPEPINDYGIGFTQPATYQPPPFVMGMGGGRGGAQQQEASGALNYNNGRGPAPPPVPQKGPTMIIRKPSAADHVQQRPAAPEKRKSWFARRFSKNS